MTFTVLRESFHALFLGTNDDEPECEGDSSRPKKKVKTTEKKNTDGKIVDTGTYRYIYLQFYTS